MSQIEITGTITLSEWDGPDYFITTSGVGPHIVAGIKASGPDGCTRRIFNQGPDPITIAHNSVLAADEDQFQFTLGLDIIVPPTGHYVEVARNWNGPSGAGWYDHA